MFNNKISVSKETIMGFIESRSDLMDDDTRINGCKNLMDFIHQDSANINYINDILLGHQWISTSELLQDLGIKMRDNTLYFEKFFDKCSAGFLGQAIYTPYELERIAKAFPSRTTMIAEYIRGDEETFNRLAKTFDTEDNVYYRIAEKYPELDVRNFLTVVCTF